MSKPKLTLCLCGEQGVKIVASKPVCARCLRLESQHDATFFSSKPHNPLAKYAELFFAPDTGTRMTTT